MTCGRPSPELDNHAATAEATSRKRKPTMCELPHNDFHNNGVQLEGVQTHDNRVNVPENKNEERIAALEEQIIASNKQIASLQTENSTLKEDVRALQKFTLKFSRCQLCDKEFKRSDRLRKHLREGDANHRRFFTQHYKTECKECGIIFKDWGAYNRHMRSERHALHVLRSAKVSSSPLCEFRTTSRDDGETTDSSITSDNKELRTATFTDSRIAASPFTSFSTQPYTTSSKEVVQAQTLPPLASMHCHSLTVQHQPLALPALEGIFRNPDQASGMGFDQSWVFEENSVGQPRVEDPLSAACQPHAAVNRGPVIGDNLVGNSLDYYSGFDLVPFSAPFHHSSSRDIYSAESIPQPLVQKDGAASDQSTIFLCNPVGAVSSHELDHIFISDSV